MFGIILGWMLNAAGSHYFGELLDILIKHLAGQKPGQKVIDAFSKGKMSESDKQLLASMTENAFRTDANFRDKLIALLLQEGIAAPIDSLPKPPKLFGRETSLLELKTLLNPHTKNAPSCIQITGGTGVGKTRFAANAVLDFRLDYVRIELREHYNAELVVEQLYKMFTWRKQAEGSFEDVVRAIVESWRRRDCLLIIDNLQYLLDKTQPEDDKAKLLLKALAESGNKLLVICWGETDAFGLTGEKVKRIHLEGLSDKAGVLKLRAEEVKGAPQSISLEDVVKRLDGNPLMLELLAGLIRRHGGDASVIDKRPDWIENSTAPMSAMWEEIGSDLQELITALCIFRMGRTPERLARYLSRESSAVQRDLDALIDWHLIGCDLELHDYYPRHDIVRDMVSNVLNEDELIKAHTKAADLWLEEGKDIGKDSIPNRIEQIRPLLEAGYHLAEARNGGLLFDLLEKRNVGEIAFVEIADRLGAWTYRIKLWQSCLELVEEDISKSRLHHHLGIAFQNRGEWDCALSEYEIGLEFAIQQDDKAKIVRSYIGIGIVYLRKGDFVTASEKFEHSMEIANQVEDKLGIAMCLHQIGLVCQAKGELDEALAKYLSSLDILEDICDEEKIAMTRHQIGVVYYLKGDLDSASEEFMNSLRIAERYGNLQIVAASSDSIGVLFGERGEFSSALECHIRALSIFSNLGDPKWSTAFYHLVYLRFKWDINEFDKAWKEQTGEDVPEIIIKASEQMKKSE